MKAAPVAACPLCTTDGGRLVVATPRFRLIHAQEPGFPAFYRLVWTAHVAELSDLAPPERSLLLEAIVIVEKALREHLQPAKINLAALGNMVPHLHWHLIARFAWDSHFPAPVWAAACREAPRAQLAQVQACLPALEAELRTRLTALD